jgi:hypothetical protein
MLIVLISHLFKLLEPKRVLLDEIANGEIYTDYLVVFTLFCCTAACYGTFNMLASGLVSGI